MNAWMTRMLTAALVLGLAASPGRAAPTVKDEGKVFSDATKEKANKLIAEIEREFKKDVFVETYNKPPANKAAEWEKNKRDKEFVKRFFTAWAEETFQNRGANGILLLMYRESPRGYFPKVEAGKDTIKKDFTREDCDALEHTVGALMAKGDDNQALLDSLEFIRQTMTANQKKVKQPSVARPSESGPVFPGPSAAHEEGKGGGIMGDGIMGWLCLLLGVVAVVWIVIGLVRAFTGAGRSVSGPMYGPPGAQGGPYPSYGGGGGGGGGGGFMSGMLGGMFGAAAGNWMYDRYVRGGPSPGGGFEPGARGAPPDSGSTGDDMGRVGGGGSGNSGGDFGDGGGGNAGGDFGGDAGGGGDFGGGDVGGGGDFGGGGGDFGGGGGDVGGGGGDFGGGGDY